jgi:hypothetical protein
MVAGGGHRQAAAVVAQAQPRYLSRVGGVERRKRLARVRIDQLHVGQRVGDGQQAAVPREGQRPRRGVPGVTREDGARLPAPNAMAT